MLDVYISSGFLPVWLLFSFLGCCLQSRSLGLVKSVDEFSHRLCGLCHLQSLCLPDSHDKVLFLPQMINRKCQLLFLDI